MKYQFRAEVTFTSHIGDYAQTATEVFNVPLAMSAADPLDLDLVIASLNNSIENFSSRGNNWVVDRINYLQVTICGL
jgi:hypothetical protein